MIPLVRALRWAVLLSLGALAACETTVAISGRFPARFAETTNVRKLIVGRFDGPGGPEFASALESHLAGATFDGQRYFTVIPAGSGRLDGGRSAAAAATGAQGLLVGTVEADVNTQAYQGSESRCVRIEDGKCRLYQSFPISCWRHSVELAVTPRLIRTAGGGIIYSARKTAGRQIQWCQGASPGASDQALAMAAQDQILEEIRRDIGPFNAVLSATLKTTGDGLNKDLKTQFTAAAKFASSGDLAEACKRWTAIDTAQTDNLPTVYDLGVCAESSGAYPKALDYYRRAHDLSPKPDAAVSASLARVEQLMKANGQLAQEAAKREAAAAAERQRQEAAARSQAAASAAAGKARQQAATRAKAAEEERQRAARAKYGAAAPAILAGRVVPGMSKDQVVAARGQPGSKRVLSPTEEMWTYGAQRIVFLNGRVSTVR